MKRIQHLITINFSDEIESAEAESDLLNAVFDIGNTYAVTAEATYDRTVQSLRSKGGDEEACITQVTSTE